MRPGETPIAVAQHLPAPPAAVWQAISDPAQMRQWYFEAIELFEPRPGFETEFLVVHDSVDYWHQWRVEEAIVARRLVDRWRYRDFAGDSRVQWTLTEQPVGTLLTLSHEVLEAFPRDRDAFQRESCQAGWEWFLQDRLVAFLDPRSGTGASSAF